MDLSFVKGYSVKAYASLVVLNHPKLKVVCEDCCMISLPAPYLLGFLVFREVPFLVNLVPWLQEKESSLMPQVLLMYGNGVLHHQDFQVSCHIGVLIDLPCIGVIKQFMQVHGLEKNTLQEDSLLQAR